MVILKISILLFLLIIVFSANTQELSLKKIYKDIVSEYEKIDTFQANFVQKNFWQEADISQESKGKIIYNSEKLLLAYSDPKGQKMFVDSTSVTVFDPNANQAMITHRTEQSLRPIELIKNYWNISDKEILSRDPEKIIVSLKTENEQDIIIQIRNNLVISFELSDNEKNSVSYNFENIEVNMIIPESIFNFELPGDVNLIDTRE